MERRTVWFSGNVQGVGFRYTAYTTARAYEVTGYVRNLPDGRVELVAEGEAAEIDQFLNELRRQMGGHIGDEKTDAAPASGHYDKFSIRH